MRLSFYGTLASILVLIGFAAVANLVVSEFDRASEMRSAVDASYARRAMLKEILSLHQDLETGQRGYIISGNEAFLEPYRAARRRLAQSMAELQASTDGQNEVAALFPSLKSQSETKLSLTDAGVMTRQQGNASAAMAMVSAGRGKTAMDRIRATLAAMDTVEARHLEQQIGKADDSRLDTQRLVLAILIILGLLLLAAGLLVLRTDAMRRRTMHEAHDAASRFRTILNSAKDGIITINPSGSIEAANEAAASMFGYDPRELIRRDVGILFEIAPDVGVVETFLRRLSRGNSGTGRLDEFMARRKDGGLLPCEVAVSSMTLAGGTYYVAIIRDISERREIEQMKAAFVSTVSHELRTPLTSIAGSLGLIAGGAAGAIPERAARLIEIAHNNSKRLVRLINEILDIEKIESGKMPFDIGDLSLGPFLEQAIAANQAFADQHGVSIALDPVPEKAMVRADPDRLMQVITNLLSNGVKFSPEGGTVRVAVRPLDRRWRVSVADQGSGISEEFRERIFQKFAQADSSDTRAKGGTGLGLSIVREIMNRLGGAISFDSREGEGATFHVDVPRVESSTADARQRGGAAATVLHVDDDLDVLRVVASALEGRAVVDNASSLAAARKAVASGRYRLLILDIGLADGSGLDLLADSRVPAIVFTAQDADPHLKTQVEAVLTKSRANLDQLTAEVERVLNLEGSR